MKTKKTSLTIKILLVLSVFILLIISLKCNYGEEHDDGGIVNFIIAVDSDMDSLTVSYYDIFSADIIKINIKEFPWSYKYKDAISYSQPWFFKSYNDSGYIKIAFYSSELENDNKYVLRDSVRYYAPFNDFSMQWASEEKVNYNYKMSAQPDSIKIKLGWDAEWADYSTDTLITNHYWSLTEFGGRYDMLRGMIINPTETDNCKFEFTSSGKVGRNYKSFLIPKNDTVYFKIYKGLLTILQ